MGGAYEALKLDTKCVMNMGTRLALNIHGMEEEDVKPGRHVFVPKVGTKERMMDFIKRLARGES